MERVRFLCRDLPVSGSAGLLPPLEFGQGEEQRRWCIQAGRSKLRIGLLVNLGGQTRFKRCLLWTLDCVSGWTG